MNHDSNVPPGMAQLGVRQVTAPDAGHGQGQGHFGYEEPTRPAVEYAQVSPYISRSRTYAFVVDDNGNPIELGSGRFAKAFLGEERWVESKTAFRRNVAIKILQKGVSDEDQMRFQMEKELLERVQGHPNIVELFALGRVGQPRVRAAAAARARRDDFMILELLDMSLEERLKGARERARARRPPRRAACASACSACSSTWCRSPRRSSTRTSCATSATATSSRPTS